MKSSSFLSVAPMMDYTDRHARYFLRLIAPHVRLYTEMITTAALIYGDQKRLLMYDSREKPLALQLGGSDARTLAQCAQLGELWGYDEINLNVGCPSDRVRSGQFGACLMLTPQVVADCIAAMQDAVSIPVTVKCRIGVDQKDSYHDLVAFVGAIAARGCKTFIIHARKAWLHGLSPKENREIPPLCYETVRRVKQDFPHLTIVLNGGIKTPADIEKESKFVDGFMIGRAAYWNPYLLAELEACYYQQKKMTRHEIVRQFIPYVQAQCSLGVKLSSMTRHILGLFHGKRGALAWRRVLSQRASARAAGIEVIESALQLIDENEKDELVICDR